uniref:Uncharacterized protein n=1 Tax=Oryza barthii TaxID=65489 RepID=A0A0D3HW65_9ORYZ
MSIWDAIALPRVGRNIEGRGKADDNLVSDSILACCSQVENGILSNPFYRVALNSPEAVSDHGGWRWPRIHGDYTDMLQDVDERLLPSETAPNFKIFDYE